SVTKTKFSQEQLLAALSLSMGQRRSVHAGRKILAGELIEQAPVIVIAPQEVALLAETDVAPYIEPWPSEDGAAAFPLGFAAMYSDSAEPNTVIVRRPELLQLDIVAALDIEQGEEITIPRRWRISGWTPEQVQETDRPT